MIHLNKHEANQVIFTCKSKKVAHPPIFYTDNLVQQVSSKNHLSLILDKSSTSDEHIYKRLHLNLLKL